LPNCAWQARTQNAHSEYQAALITRSEQTDSYRARRCRHSSCPASRTVADTVSPDSVDTQAVVTRVPLAAAAAVAGWSVDVPDKAKLVAFWIGHHHYDAFGIIVPLVQRTSAESYDLLLRMLQIVDDKVEMDPRLATLGFGHGLEGDGGLCVALCVETPPSRQWDSDHSSQNGHPERCEDRWICTLDSDS